MLNYLPCLLTDNDSQRQIKIFNQFKNRYLNLPEHKTLSPKPSGGHRYIQRLFSVFKI